MLESVLADVLTRVLGQYLQGIDRDSVNFGAWSGLIELRNVQLRPEALAVLFETLGVALPVTVQTGFIELLRLVVPWKSIGTTPVQIHMNGVTIVARPVRGDGSDDSQLEIRDRRIKRAKLDTDDAVREASWDVTLQHNQPSEKESSWSSWLVSDQLRTTIVENIQIHLSDIIIRFEDPYSNPKAPYVASLQCESFIIVSANEKWKEAFVEQASDNTTRKLLEVKGFKIDWAPIIPSSSLSAPDVPLPDKLDDQASGSFASPELLRKYLSSSSIQDTPDHSAPAATRSLLHPVDGSMRLRLARSDRVLTEPDFRQQDPAVDLDICFPDVFVDLNDVQYSCLLQTSLYFARVATRGFRPTTPKARWKWAVDQLLPNCTARRARALRCSEEGLARTRRTRDSYIALRLSVLKARRTGVEEPEQISEELERLEASLTIEEVLAYRDAVDIQAERISQEWVARKEPKTPPEVESHGTSTSSFWSMLGYSDEVADDVKTPPPKTDERESFHLETPQPERSPSPTASAEARASTILTLRVAFLLRKATLRMSERGFPVVPTPRVELNFRDFRIGVMYSSAKDLITEAVLGSVEAWDLQRQSRMVYSRGTPYQGALDSMEDDDMITSYPRDVSEAIENIRNGSNPAKELLLEEDSYDDHSSEAGERSEDFLDELEYMSNDPTSAHGINRPGLRTRRTIHDPERSRSTYRITEAEFHGNPNCLGAQKYIAALRYSQTSGDGGEGSLTENATLDISVATLEAVVDGPKGSFVWGLKFWQPKGMVQDPLMSFLGAAAGARIAELRLELEGAILADSVPMQVNAVILAPRFIVPSSSEHSPAIVANLGTLGICTTDSSLNMQGHTPFSSEKHHFRYANYVLTLDDLGMYFSPDLATAVSRSLSSKPGGPPSGKGEVQMGNRKPPNIAAVERIIRPFSLRFVLQTLRDSTAVQVAQGSSSEAVPQGDGIAKIRLRGNIPELSLILTQNAFQHLLATAQGWTEGLKPSNVMQSSTASVEQATRPWQDVGEDGVARTSTHEVLDGVNALANVMSPTSDRNIDKHATTAPLSSTLAAYSVKVIVRTVSVELRESLEARLVTAVASDLSVKIVKTSKTNLQADLSLRSWSVTDGSRGRIAAFRRLLYSGTVAGSEGVSPPRSSEEGAERRQSSSVEDENFVNIRYSLDFAKQEQQVAFRFLSLHMNCVRETYLRLISFFDRVRKYVKQRRQSHRERKEEHAVVANDTSLGSDSLGPIRRSLDVAAAGPTNMRKTSVTSRFEGFTFQLVASSGIIAVFEMKDSSIHFLRDDNGTKRAWGSFGSFSIRDLTAPLREHVSVLSYERSSPSADRVDELDLAEMDSTEERTDEWVLSFPTSFRDSYHLQVTFEGIRMLFLYRFFAVLEEYVSALVNYAGPAFSSIPEETPPDLTDADRFGKSPSPISISSQLSIAFDLRDLAFRIPRHSACLSEALTFKIFEVHVDNTERESSTAWFARFDGVQGVVQYVLPNGDDSPGGMSVSSTFLTDCLAELRVQQAKESDTRSDSVLGNVVNVASVHFPDPLRINLSEAQYSVLYFVLTENITETVAGEEVTASLEHVHKSWDSHEPMIVGDQVVHQKCADNDIISAGMSEELALALSSSASVNPVRTTKRVDMKIPAISLEISRGWDVTQESCKILGVYMTNVSLGMSVSSPRRLGFEFGGTLLSVADLRQEPRSLESNFIVRLSSADSEHVDGPGIPQISGESVSVCYDKEGTERPSILVSLNRLHIEIVPELLRDLSYLAIPGWPFLSSSLFAPDYEYVGRMVSLVLSESEILLFSEAYQNDRRAIVLTGELEVKMDWMRKTAAKTFFLRSRQFEISAVNEVPDVIEHGEALWYGFKDYCAQPFGKSHAPLIYPTDSVVEFVGPNVDDSGRRVQISVDAALCLLCTSEVPLLKALSRRLSSLKPTYLSQRLWKQPGSAPGTLSKLEEECDPKEEQKRKARESLSLSLSIPASRYLVTDDSGGRFVPIVEVRLSSFSVQAHEKSMVQVDGELSMDFFNPTKGCWEPALEPWSLSASMSRGQSGARAFVVRSVECLNINIVPATIAAARTVARALRDAAGASKKSDKANLLMTQYPKAEESGDIATSQRPSVAAFFVRNELGIPIMMNVPGKSEWTSVFPNAEVEVGAQSEALVSSTTNQEVRSREDALRCLISISSFAPQELSASEAGKQFVTFQPQQDPGPSLSSFTPVTGSLKVLWEVELRNGVPVCTVRSPFRIVNNTRTKIDLVIVADGSGFSKKSWKEKNEDFVTLDPLEDFPVPIHDCEDILHVRPAIEPSIDSDTLERRLNRPFSWSSGFPRLAWLLTLAQEKALSEHQMSPTGYQQTALNVPLVECKSLSGDRHSFFFKVIPSTGAPVQFEDTNSWLDISITAPIILGNKLPKPLSYRVTELEKTATSSSSFKGTAGAPILAAGMISALEDVYLHFSGENLNFTVLSLAFDNGHSTGSASEIVSSTHSRMPSQFGSPVRLGDIESGKVKWVHPSATEVKDSRGQTSKQFRTNVQPFRNGVSRFDFFARCWLRNRSDTAVQVCSRPTFYSPGSVPCQLRERPPFCEPDEYVCFEGPYLAFRIIRSNSSRTDEESADVSNWWTTPLVVEELDKPVLINLPGRSLELEVRPSIGLGCSTFIVTVRNASWIINSTNSVLQWCQQSSLDDHGNCPTRLLRSLSAGEMCGLHWDSKSSARALHLRLADSHGHSEWIWSPAIPLDIGFSRELPAKMYRPKTHDQYIARVASKEIAGNSRALIVYEEDRQNPPYRIVNLCRERAVAFSQLGSRERPWLVRAGKSTRYSWDDPLAPSEHRRLSIQVLEKEDLGDGSSNASGSSGSVQRPRPITVPHSTLNIDKVGNRVMVLSDPYDPPVIFNVSVDGATKIVTLLDEGFDLEGHSSSRSGRLSRKSSQADPVPVLGWDDIGTQPSMSYQAESIDTESLSDYPVALRASRNDLKPPESTPRETGTDAAMFLHSIGVSVMGGEPEEVLYLSLSGLLMNYESFGKEQSIAVSVEHFQIDNQLTKTQYPVLLWIPPRNLRDENNRTPEERETVNNAIVIELHRDVGEDDIIMVKNFQAFVHPFNVSFEEGLVTKVLQFLDDSALVGEAKNAERLKGADEEERIFTALIPGRMDVALGRQTGNKSSSKRVYIHDLEIAASAIRLTSAGSGAAIAKAAGLSSSARTVVGLLLNVENCDFEFPSLNVQNAFDSFHHFLVRVRTYYVAQLHSQRIKLITSNSLVGNPAALFDAFGTGARDFLREPGRAKGSADFFASVGRGSKSLLAHTVGGIVESVGGIPRAVSSGLERAVGDNDYLAERERIRGSNLASGYHGSSSKNPAQGLATGALSLAHGISSGVTGFIREPVQGARQGGAGGLLKGIGKAFIGGVAKPVAGAMDLVAEPVAGLSRQIADPSGGAGLVVPLRPPRAFRGKSQRIECFDRRYSVGVWLLKAVLISSGATVGSQLVDWIELSDRTNRCDVNGDLWVWYIVQRFSRSMPGPKKQVRADLKRHGLGQGSNLRLESKPEKTRVALVTEDNLIIATLDCKLVTMIPIWRDASYEIAGHEKELVIRATIIDGNVPGSGRRQMSSGGQSLIQAPWDVSASTRRRKPAVGESVTDRILCGGVDAEIELRKLLADITTRHAKAMEKRGQRDDVISDPFSAGQELMAASEWRVENERELRSRRSSMNDWSMRDGGSRDGKMSAVGLDEVGKTAASLQRTVKRLSSNGATRTEESERNLRIIVANMLSGDLELCLMGGTLEHGKWIVEAPVDIASLDAQMMEVEWSGDSESEDGLRVSGHVIYDIVDGRDGGNRKMGQVILEFFNDASDGGSSFTTKASTGFEGEFERGSGANAAVVFTIRRGVDADIGEEVGRDGLQGFRNQHGLTLPWDDYADEFYENRAEQVTGQSQGQDAGRNTGQEEMSEDEKLVQQLVDIGFKFEDAVAALSEAGGDLVKAVDVLTR